jgi:hypothetical protein
MAEFKELPDHFDELKEFLVPIKAEPAWEAIPE